QLEPVNQFHEQKVAEPLPSVAPAVPEPIVFETAATEPDSPVLESPAEATGSHFVAPARQPIIPPLTPVEYEQAAGYESIADEIEAPVAHFEEAHEHPSTGEDLIAETPMAMAEVAQASSAAAQKTQAQKSPGKNKVGLPWRSSRRLGRCVRRQISLLCLARLWCTPVLKFHFGNASIGRDNSLPSVSQYWADSRWPYSWCLACRSRAVQRL